MVAGHDLDAGIRLQPSGDGLGRTLGRKIDRLIAALQIQDFAAIETIAAHCEA
jgi:hypothetical protein